MTIQPFCPVCSQPMRLFGDQWKCINIKAHDQATGTGKGDVRTKGTAKERKRKKKKA